VCTVTPTSPAAALLISSMDTNSTRSP
jgi:hypothetical protein